MAYPFPDGVAELRASKSVSSIGKGDLMKKENSAITKGCLGGMWRIKPRPFQETHFLQCKPIIMDDIFKKYEEDEREYALANL